MPATVVKFKVLTFRLSGVDYQCQLYDGKLVNNTPDGEVLYTFCGPDETGETREEAEPSYALELKFYADYRSGGISDYLWLNDQQRVAYFFDHHPDISAQHVRWTGECKIKAPTVGGEVRTNEITEVTLPIFGKPTYTRIP